MADADVMPECVSFLTTHGTTLLQQGLRNTVVVHLTTLLHYQLISTEQLEELLELLRHIT
jgi:hypothetical protein